jgi:DNA modification methylase
MKRQQDPSLKSEHIRSTGSFQPQIDYRNVDSLTLNPRNARTHSDKQIAQLATAIQEFGFIVPIVVDGDNLILAGHGRQAAARQLNLSHVPVITADHLSDEQRRAYVIADNRLAERADWDRSLLAVELKELSELDLAFDVELTGFETSEIDLLIEGQETEKTNEDEQIPEPPRDTPPVSRDSDLWLLGNHRIACGNSLEASTFERLGGGERAAAAFMDPPVNVRIDGHAGGLGNIHHREFPMASGEMTEAEFTGFLRSSLTTVSEHCVDGAVLYICMDWRHLFELQTAARQAGLSTLNLCVWSKTNAGMGSFYRSKHELVLVLKKGNAPHRNNIQLGQYGRYRTNVWEYEGANTLSRKRRAELAVHPTVKPTSLVADAIKDVTRRGDLVLDGFAGSGTTILAGQKTGRRCYAAELDPGYVDVAVRRWQSLTGEDAIHAETGLTFEQAAESRAAPLRQCRKRRKPVEV